MFKPLYAYIPSIFCPLYSFSKGSILSLLSAILSICYTFSILTVPPSFSLPSFMLYRFYPVNLLSTLFLLCLLSAYLLSIIQSSIISICSPIFYLFSLVSKYLQSVLVAIYHIFCTLYPFYP